MRLTKMLGSVVPAAIVVAMLSATGSMGQSEGVKADTAKAAMPAAKQLKPQTTCPVSGDPIDKKLYVDYKGKRIYVCCSSCIATLKKNPEKYIKKLEKMGQGVESIAAASSQDGNSIKTDTSKTSESGYWTCPMHPEIHQSTPGQCPICGMNLEFKKSEKDSTKTKTISHSKMKM
jgi:YHS domain-containing protein